VSLLDEAREASSEGRYAPCSIASLDADLRDELEEALDDPTVTAAGLERALGRRGIVVKAHTLRRHKRGGCSCDPG
jgi:hypothetical protein